MDYNQTLNLPKTEFEMRANLPKREPDMLKEMYQQRIYEQLLEKNKDKPQYVLHDGPPYANGDIHLGTSMNKVLKDIVHRYKSMTGFCSHYIPGFDMHGLPTELKAMKKMGVKPDMKPLEIRAHCKEFATGYMNNQREQFKRLGVIGDWDNPYLTLNPHYESRQVEIFGTMAEKGYIYKGLKPVYWCPSCRTALAEAEIEYSEDECFSIYVKFPVKSGKEKLLPLGIDGENTYFVIWTTTTWTLPGNMAICLGPDIEYTAVTAGNERYIVAKELAESSMKAAGITDYTLSDASVTGKELEHMTVSHPFLSREPVVIVGDHVTLESGTGCVHTAPGHGAEDFQVCEHYGIEIVVPVDDFGVLTEDAGQFAGLKTEASNKVISKHLEETGHLFAIEKISHQYPHCWRCHEPIIFRATNQWFCSIGDFKPEVLKAIKDVKWIPGWGEDRITSMVNDRQDWCISRQRTWGVPIPAFYCDDCGKYLITKDTIAAVAALFDKEGSDAWFKYDASDILPKGTKCSCGGTSFTKEKDIMDVWFDSGSSHASCLEDRGLKWPCDLYLEGSDQYRGWFQSSLLTAVATRGQAPYKAVCTHGWVVDDEKRKMSKSVGNVIDPLKVVEQYGADVLRLWVSSSDYHADVHVSNDLLKQLSEGYRKIRNTARFILGNLYDFNPNTDAVPDYKLFEIDRFALMRFNQLIERVRGAYEAFDFHIVYHTLHSFCVVDMSNFYLDILKDRLYVENPSSEARRSAQTAMWRILRGLTLLLSPVLAFTSNEIWQSLPKTDGDDTTHVMFNEMPSSELAPEPAVMAKWERIIALREDVNKALELSRASKIIGASLEAHVTLFAEGETYDFLTSCEDELKAVFIVSDMSFVNGTGGSYQGALVSVTVEPAAGTKCERCWSYTADVGSSGTHPTLCGRCAGVVSE